jgi:hypothetical protein
MVGESTSVAVEVNVTTSTRQLPAVEPGKHLFEPPLVRIASSLSRDVYLPALANALAASRPSQLTSTARAALARPFFEKALALEPAFAPAREQLAALRRREPAK